MEKTNTLLDGPKLDGPKFRKIKQSVLADIREGRLRPGDKLPVRTALMEHYDATRATVDKALTELVQEKVLRASRRTGTFVAPRAQLQKLAVLAYVAGREPDRILQQYDYQAMYGALLDLLRDRSVEVLTPTEALAHPDRLAGFDFVFSNPSTRRELAVFEGVLGGRDRIIPLNRPFDGFAFVSTDHRGAARDLTESLLRGLPPESEPIFLDLRFCDTEDANDVAELRKQGFLDACARHRRFYRLVDVWLREHGAFHNPDVVDISRLDGVLPAAAAPAVIISPTKCLTGAVLRRLHERGLTPYRDVYYADFDNYDAVANTGYAVTSVLEDFTGIAEAAVRQLDDPARRPRFVPHTLVNTRSVEPRAPGA